MLNHLTNHPDPVCFFTVGRQDGTAATSHSSYADQALRRRERRIRRQAGRLGYRVMKHRGEYVVVSDPSGARTSAAQPIVLSLAQVEQFFYWLTP